jgi:predicted RNA-binding Zn ribbon-like protein
VTARSYSASFIGGRLALEFVNELGSSSNFTWERFLRFLLAARIISSERGAQLLSLPQIDPQSSDALLAKAWTLHAALDQSFDAMVRGASVMPELIRPVNEALRITEGHDELVRVNSVWHLEFVAREEGLEWLLAAIARSAAEIIAEGPSAPLHVCANPACRLFFYDTSRTHRRRWCSMSRCGNRHKVAAFSHRHSSAHRTQ